MTATELSSANALEADAITQVSEKSWNELFSDPRGPVEAFQIRALQTRFSQLRPKIKTLRTMAERQHINSIDHLNDVLPLLFAHTVYKSYPMSLLESGRFGMLTQWLAGLTSIDLSSVNTDACNSIDSWLQTLEATTCLMVDHTTGTTGKLSFLPRSSLERTVWNRLYMKLTEGFGQEPGIKLGPGGIRVPVIFPSHRHGRYVTQRVLKHLADHIAPTPQQCYTLTSGTLSADLVSLAGRVRVAQAKGELGDLQLNDGLREALQRYVLEQERRPAEIGAFFARIVSDLAGQQVFLMAQNVFLYQAALQAEQQGLSKVFAPDSVCGYGGGSKGVSLPDDWLARVKHFSGIQNWFTGFGMSELNGLMPQCPAGHFHIPPTVIPYVLDPVTSGPLPRSGSQTGRFGFYDLLAQTYWGGFVSGDRVTIEWDGECLCGRKGAYLLDNVTRYSDQVTGDDKVSCSESAQQTDVALQSLLN